MIPGKRWRNSTPVILSLLLLVGLGAERHWSHVPSGSVQRHHGAVRASAAQLPTHFGDWVGSDIPPPVALGWLETDTTVCRRYVNLHTGTQATVLLIHVQDARRMLDIDPLDAMAREGWTRHRSIDQTWPLNDQTIVGTIDELHQTRQTPWQHMMIASFFILPDELLRQDLKAVRRAASHYTDRYFGAGRFMVFLDQPVSTDERTHMIPQLIAGHREIIRLMQSGVMQ